MKTSWTSGLSAEQKKELEDDFNSCPLLRERLTALLRTKITSIRKDSLSRDEYANPSWAFKQADAVGYERALNEVISLLSSKNE